MLRSTSVVVAALVALTGCSQPAADRDEPEVPVPAPATAGPDTGNLLLHGRLTRSGEPVAGGKIWVSVMAELPDAEVGDDIPIWESAVVSSEEDGTFAVSVDDERLTSAFFNGEFLNYEIDMRHDDTLALWGTTAHLVGDGVWRSDQNALVGDPVTEVSVDLDAPTITLTDSFGESETSDLVVLDGEAAGSYVPSSG